MQKLNIIILLPLLFALACATSRQMTTATATLKNTYWKLAKVNGKAVTTAANQKEIHMILTDVEEQHLKGFAGCNTIAGTYSLSGDSIQFKVISTRMMCIDAVNVEDAFLKVLSMTNRFEIKGEILTLFNKKKIVAKFGSVYF